MPLGHERFICGSLNSACMFVLFLRESYSTEVVAIGGVAVLLATGVLPYQQALTIMANPAPWTIVAMFIVMGHSCARVP